MLGGNAKGSCNDRKPVLRDVDQKLTRLHQTCAKKSLESEVQGTFQGCWRYGGYIPHTLPPIDRSWKTIFL